MVRVCAAVSRVEPRRFAERLDRRGEGGRTMPKGDCPLTGYPPLAMDKDSHCQIFHRMFAGHGRRRGVVQCIWVRNDSC